MHAVDVVFVADIVITFRKTFYDKEHELVLDKGNNVREDVFMELTLPQFYQFLAQMESAKQHLDFLSSDEAV